MPSTGDAFPYFHIFFRMADGSTMAFFECTDLPLPSSPSHPAYDVFDHIALEVSDTDELIRWKQWLVSQGVDVLGPIDHKGIIQSIYFRDPNGYRLELTTPIDPAWQRHSHPRETWKSKKLRGRNCRRTLMRTPPRAIRIRASSLAMMVS